MAEKKLNYTEAQNEQIKGALKTLQAFHNQRGFLIMFDHDAYEKDLPRQDISSILESLPDEIAEKIWEELTKSKLEIKGIDIRPPEKGPRQRWDHEDILLDRDLYPEDHELQDLLSQTSEEGLLTQREEIELTIKRKKGLRPGGNFTEGQSAEKELVTRNLRLVASIAKTYIGKGLDLGELFQEGAIGTQRAAQKFDWRRGLKFSTYATFWIRQAIGRAIGQTAETIRHPLHFQDMARKLAKAEAILKQKLRVQNPSDEDIAEFMQITLEEVREIKENRRTTDSLEEPVGENDDALLGDSIEDTTPGPEEINSEKDEEDEFSSRARELLSILRPKERKILVTRYLSDTAEPLSLDDVAEKCGGITRERVRQIESRARGRMIMYLKKVKNIAPENIIEYVFGERSQKPTG